MIKKTTVLAKGVEKNFGTITGLINSLVISNPEADAATVTIKSSSIILWNGILDPVSTVRVSLDIIIDENVFSISDKDNTNIIINIIQTT